MRRLVPPLIKTLVLCSLLALTRTEALAADPPLVAAATTGDAATVSKLLKQGTDPNTADANKLTALNWAAYKGHLAAVEALVKHGATVDAHGNKHGWTPLMNASAMGHEDVAAYLIAHGADVNARSVDADDRWTPLMYAAFKGRVEVVALLLDHGAAIDAVDVWHETALALAKSNQQQLAAAFLSKRGADPRILPAFVSPDGLCQAGARSMSPGGQHWKWTLDSKSNTYSCWGGDHDFPGGAGNVLMYTYQVDGTAKNAQSIYMKVDIYSSSLPNDMIASRFGAILRSVYNALQHRESADVAIKAVGTLTDTAIDTPIGRLTATYSPGDKSSMPYNGASYVVRIALKPAAIPPTPAKAATH